MACSGPSNAHTGLHMANILLTVLHLRAPTVYDRIDAAATINFSTQFGVATIRERRLFESGVYIVRRGYRLK